MMPGRDAQMKNPERNAIKGYGGILGKFLLFHEMARLLCPSTSFARLEMLDEL